MPFRFLLSFVLLLSFASTVFSSGPPTDPVLRIEAGAHTAPIKGVATDAAGRWLVTASEDKTLRVWEAGSGKLLSTLRPPIGAGHEGKLFSVDLSPDGSTIACGGVVASNWGEKNYIYLFNRASGLLVRRLAGLEGAIDHLAFSPDGRYLAASYGGSNGIRLYRTDTWAQIGSDRDYKGRPFSVDFSADNRLVATSLDGDLRLYQVAESGLRQLVRRKAPHGSRPFGARFSPDGATIAVGYYDTSKVSLLDTTDLSSQGETDTSGVSNGNLSNITWSPNGLILYAGGGAKKIMNGRWTNYVRRWDRAGKGLYLDLDTGASGYIITLASLPDGTLVAGTGTATLTVLNPDGTSRWRVAPPTADYRNSQEYFHLFTDSSTVRFSFEPFGKALHRFSVNDRSLRPDNAGDDLNRPTLSAPGLTITDWEGKDDPKLNGRPIKLNQYETSHALAIAPRGVGFVLGTDLSLRYFSRSGEELWQQEMATCWAVNVSADGRLVVAAFGDGTIRWYRARDGKELLAFFPHADRKRWVLWTPSGYYDASPGGEELIGWHVNNGKDQAADFFPVSRFRGTYYRPDVIDRILETLEEGEALRLANQERGGKTKKLEIAQMLPPVVKILSPEDGSQVSRTDLALRYSVRTPSGDSITSVKILVDGRPVANKRGISVKAKTKAEGEATIAVIIPPRDCEVTLIAENANGASVPSTVRLKWVGQVPVSEEFVIQPKLYLLAVGVSDYADPSLRLDLAAKDAKDFAQAFTKQKGLLYRDVVTKVLTDGEATKGNLLDGLDWLVKETTSKDVAVLFMAGHGVNDPSGIYYYLPQNVDLDKLRRTGLPFDEIRNTVASLAGKALFFVDTCHSGNVMGTRRGLADINAVVNELTSAENGAVVFASSTGRQYSLEDPAWGNGAFTKALVEGINGKADYGGKGKITINMLDLYLSERVKELTGGKQTPTTTKPQTIQDFPIAVKR